MAVDSNLCGWHDFKALLVYSQYKYQLKFAVRTGALFSGN